MAEESHPWVDVTWDVIEPGDRVLHPDGTEFHVTAKIDMPGDGELTFLLSPVDPNGGVGEVWSEVGEMWTDRPRGQLVKGWRFNHHSAIPGAEQFAVGRLRLAGFDVTALQD